MEAPRMLRTIIIDDEQRGRSVLRLLMEKFCPLVSVEAEASSAVEGIGIIKSLRPDLVLLDIEMPVMNGFQLLDELPERDFAVVFVSAHERYTMKAISYRAMGYLLKPVDLHELQSAIARAAEFVDRTRSGRDHNRAGVTIADMPAHEHTTRRSGKDGS